MRGWWMAVVALTGCAHLSREELEERCRERLPNQCVELTRELLRQRKDGEAVLWLEYACALGDEHSCLLHGGMYEWGRGVPQDRAHARRLYDAACARGANEGCAWRERLDAQDAA